MLLSLHPRGKQSRLMLWLSPLLAALLTLITSIILFVILKHPPLATLKIMLIDPINSVYGITELLVKALPLLMCALGLAVAFRAQVWNIGAEGQFLMGGLIGSAVAVNVIEWETYWALVLVLLAGMASGALWGLLCAWLKTRFNANEILTSIMLNYIALNLLQYAVHGPLKDPEGMNFPESALFGGFSRLPVILEGTRLHIGLYFALLAIVIVWVLLQKSFFGFQVKVLGLDQTAAKFVGFREKRLVWLVMLISGGLAGLAGVCEVTGPIGQLVPQISPGYGYAAITVAFLGRLNPIGIVFSSLLMALLYVGGENAQIAANLPQSITELFQGMVLLFLLACDVFIMYRPRLRCPWRKSNHIADVKTVN